MWCLCHLDEWSRVAARVRQAGRLKGGGGQNIQHSGETVTWRIIRKINKIERTRCK